ncbi:uncharacterized protein BDR25DRAFT_306886 [Lindgomyces ingoldianus]|uniref:Uncharacterized protein n=1 Tax=Lindgomyces ingoldianus TaxID=673940 RepID=A0ACB6QDU5_9PLEO|nr:uncharacterized protein BDR25DRAFT_306886 [Lindgomyces ingoldianus]KAF2465030.1 hypothetical protein BDR25DRAFT_306886 [Lindgomyces ingoldianus]
MNAVGWSYDDALRSAHTTTPPPATMPSMYTSPRNTTGPLAVDTASMSPSDHSSTASPWQRMNPHAAPQTNSKTSQYIDKITQENERLRRELKAERAARENEAKQVSAARTRAEDSRGELQHLQVLVDANKRAIERKDRKLDEMKASLELESKRRKEAEARAEEALSMLGDIRSETQRELAAAYEMRHLAETNAEAARDGFKRITDGYERKVRAINEELNELRKERMEDADQIKRQMIISDQIQHETARKLRTEDKMTDMMAQYKAEHRAEVDNLVQEAEQMRLALPSKEAEAAEVIKEMKEIRDKMKWVMALKAQQSNSK